MLPRRIRSLGLSPIHLLPGSSEWHPEKVARKTASSSECHSDLTEGQLGGTWKSQVAEESETQN